MLQKDPAHAGSFSAIHDGSGTVTITGSDSFDCVPNGMPYGSLSRVYLGSSVISLKTYGGKDIVLNDKFELSCYAPGTYTFRAEYGGGIQYSASSCIFSGRPDYLYSKVTLSNTPELSIKAERISKNQPFNIGANYNFPSQKDSCYDAGTNTDRCKTRTAGLYIDGALLINDNGFGNLGVSGALTYTFDPTKNPISSGYHTVRATAGCVSTGSSAEKTVYVEPEDDPCLKVGKPVSVASGNVYLDKTDFTLKGQMPVEFTRYYNSGAGLWRGFGQYWSHTYDTRVITFGIKTYRVMNPNGISAYYIDNDGDGIYDPDLPKGERSKLIKNSNGTFTRVYYDGTKEEFNAAGYLIAKTDRNNNSITLTRNTGNQLTKITDPSGRETTITNDGSGRISALTLPDGSRYTYTYTTGLLDLATYPEGSKQKYEYISANGLKIGKVKDENNQVTETHTYDAQGRAVTSSIDGTNDLLTLNYLSDSQTTVTDSLGRVTTYNIDKSLGKSHTTSITGPGCKECGGQGDAAYTYDNNLNILTKTEADGRVTAYTYDTNSNLLTKTEASGTINARTTTYTYETIYNQITSITDPAGSATTYDYDTKGNLTSIIDPNGATTTLTYNTNGLITRIIDPTGSSTNITYDQYGNPATITDSLGNTTNYTYDILGRLSSVQDANGNLTSYATDPLGRITQIKDSLNQLTRYSYNTAGGITSITDANSSATTYEYNTAARLTKETDPEGHTTTYTYDTAGNLKTKTDATGITTSYTYDTKHRLTNITYPDAAHNLSYTYNTTGNIITMTDPAGTTNYTYDNLNQLLSETRQINGPSGITKTNYTTTYTYSATGNITSITYPDGRTAAYSLDKTGRPTAVTETKDAITKGLITNITYNPNSTTAAITYSNGITTTRSYDSRGLLNSLNTGALKQLSYTRDNIGNITAINDLLSPSKTKTYTYDALYRLTQATGPWGALQYSYDPTGNRTTETTAAGTSTYSYAAKGNRLLSAAGVKPYTFSHDSNGNATTENQRQYTYSQNQRLIKAAEGANTLGEYIYNGNGQRVKKTVNGKTTHYIYDRTGSLIQELDGEGNPAAAYIYLNNLTLAGPIARIEMNRDLLPPVTTLTLGEPQYKNTAAQYISANTLITLTAADEGNPPSGLDYIEYRIDNETLWTRYLNPFTLTLSNNIPYTDGTHTINYRSADKTGNSEDSKTAAVYLDATTPQSAINTGNPGYQAVDTLYITKNTPITITATDTASGVQKTEYAIDNGIYSPYTAAFTLQAQTEGQHTINYRATDNVSNTEQDKTLTVNIDNTAPVTELTASDPLSITAGLTNTVSPNTRFYLNATDNLSGIKNMEYRIDSSGWTTYTNGFNLPLTSGTHTLGCKATDNLGNEEAEKTLTVRQIILEVTKGISLAPIVLGGAFRETGGYDKEDDHTKQTETINTLTSILTASGLNYYLPQTADEFKQYLRTGRYNTYILIDSAKETLTEELKEAVNYGDGLIYIKTKADDEEKMADLFGVEYNGESTNKDMTATLIESPLSAATSLQTTGRAIKTTITSTTAQSLGTVTDKKESYPVIVSNSYGRGKTILFSFDILNSPDSQKVKELLINALNHTAPKAYHTRALADMPVNINIRNSTETAEIKITETTPQNTTTDTTTLASTQTGNTIQWNLTINANEKKTPAYYLNLPDTAGTYSTDAEISYNNLGNYRLYGNYNLTLTIEQNSAELPANIITDIQNLIPATKKESEKISGIIKNLNKLTSTATTRKEAEKNLEKLTEAAKELDEITTDTTAIRLKLDELLKIWQKKWSLLPEEKHSWIERYRLEFNSGPRTNARQTANKNNPILIAAVGPVSGLFNAPGMTNETIYFYHTDHLGTPILMTDVNGNKVWEAEYLPFGETYSITGTATNNLRFPGQYYDEETGLHYNYFRDYKPEIGRYIEKDPIGLAGGVNPYVYVRNNSIRFIDPLGLDWIYSQSTGQLTYLNNQTGVTIIIGNGYSGNGTGLNNPDMQDVGKVGPIPEGTWTIGPPTSRGHIGDSMGLTPNDGTDTFDRNGFLIHGDNTSGNQSASKGCIILKRKIRNLIGNSGDNTLRVVR